ncbi:hypothetical protein D3C80_801480 [compost metagenome]
MVRADLNLFRLWQQITDAAKEALIGLHVRYRPGVSAVPGIQFALQVITLGQQSAVARRQIVHQGIETPPEMIRRNLGAGEHLILDEVLEVHSHLQTLAWHALGHSRLSYRLVHLF